ncbi:Uncharacterised protein [Stenotrophomonas maltophilia]|nr:Uncharacterised protein [Stenotrophomonas maltophilia]
MVVVRAQPQALAFAYQGDVAVGDEAVIPGTDGRVHTGQRGNTFLVPRVHRTRREEQPVRLPEPGMPAQHRRHRLLAGLDRKAHLQGVGLQLQVQHGNATEGPVAVVRQRQRQPGCRRIQPVDLPRSREAQPMNGMPVEVERQPMRPAIKAERSMADAPGPGHHRVAAPGDRSRPALLRIHQPLHALVTQVRHAPARPCGERNLQFAASQPVQFTGRQRGQRIIHRQHALRPHTD